MFSPRGTFFPTIEEIYGKYLSSFFVWFFFRLCVLVVLAISLIYLDAFASYLSDRKCWGAVSYDPNFTFFVWDPLQVDHCL